MSHDSMNEFEKQMWEDLQKMFRADIKLMEEQSRLRQHSSISGDVTRHASQSSSLQHAASGHKPPAVPPSSHTRLTFDRSRSSATHHRRSRWRAILYTLKRMLMFLICYLVAWVLLSLVIVPFALHQYAVIAGEPGMVHLGPFQTLETSVEFWKQQFVDLWRGSVAVSTRQAEKSPTHSPLRTQQHQRVQQLNAEESPYRINRPGGQSGGGHHFAESYVPNSAWLTMSRENFHVVQSPRISGQAPIIWLSRFHVDVVSAGKNNTLRDGEVGSRKAEILRI